MSLDPGTDTRRAAALELQALADEFERSDEAALRRTRILCWVVAAITTSIVLVLLFAGADWRYLGAFWFALVGLTWGGYALSSWRQREQTGRLRALAARWRSGDAAPLG